jgi:hypothetical protein
MGTGGVEYRSLSAFLTSQTRRYWYSIAVTAASGRSAEFRWGCMGCDVMNERRGRRKREREREDERVAETREDGGEPRRDQVTGLRA